MTTYQIIHGESRTSNETPGTLSFTAASDEDAVNKLRKLVSEGLRNEAWANMELSDGRMYGARNVRGNAVGGHQ